MTCDVCKLADIKCRCPREWYEIPANIHDLSYYLVNVCDFSVVALLAFLEKTWKWEDKFNEMREYDRLNGFVPNEISQNGVFSWVDKK